MTQGQTDQPDASFCAAHDDRQYFPVALFHGGLRRARPLRRLARAGRHRATTSTTGLILLLATGVTSAISIVLSQYVGANDTDRVRKGIVASGWITLLLGVVLGLISVFAARPLMQL